jgi:cytochrome c peroxidase
MALGLDLYMPVPDTNPLSVEKMELGRRLFYDRRLSRDGSIACASCHDPARAFSVDRVVAPGVGGRLGRRNAPALINRGYGRAFFWDARSATLEAQVVLPIQDPNEMDLTLDEARARMTAASRRSMKWWTFTLVGAGRIRTSIPRFGRSSSRPMKSRHSSRFWAH